MKVSERFRYESYSWYLCAQSTTMVLFACIRFHSQLYADLYKLSQGERKKEACGSSSSRKRGGFGDDDVQRKNDSTVSACMLRCRVKREHGQGHYGLHFLLYRVNRRECEPSSCQA